MINICLIGAGGIGSRHLQGLALLKKSANIFVIDISDESLKVAKDRFESVSGSEIHKIVYAKDIDVLTESIDVAIIATSAAVRRKIIENLVKKTKIKGLILEKVLFQKIDDYAAVEKLINENGIKTWVNCPQRLYPGMVDVKALLMGEDILHYSFVGSNWGLGCNTVHYMDNIAFLTDCCQMAIDSSQLDKAIYPSKRNGYVEYFGTLTANSPRCKKAMFTSFRDGNVPTIEKIITENIIIDIFYSEQKMIVSKASNNWNREELPFLIKYQSGLSDGYVIDIVNNNSCKLPTFKESSQLHLAFIASLLKLNKEIGEDDIICSIT